jgi:hypothetical protein
MGKRRRKGRKRGKIVVIDRYHTQCMIFEMIWNGK